MLDTKKKYVSKKPDEFGIVAYNKLENKTWQTLIQEQMPIIRKYACQSFLKGLEKLQFSTNSIPQLPNVSKVLQAETGWSVAPVTALIGFDKFFNLLANRKFPAATFIRTPEELHYLQEPDIYHELFGHCPMLTNQVYADFMQKYGELGVGASKEDQIMLARFYWFTVEFGLILENNTLKAYGGGILSSIEETPYSIDSDTPNRKPFNPIEILRTLYRIDIIQTKYYIIESYQEIYDILNQDIFGMMKEARRLGMIPL